jgi:hypothetical protein
MRIAWIVCIATAAQAQPSAIQFDDCKARRKVLTAEAMKIADADERARRLIAMPVCRRNPDNSVEVVEPAAPQPDTPFAPHIELAARTGIVGVTVISERYFAPTGIGPLVELEAGYRIRRPLSIGVLASYARFSDDTVVVYPSGQPSIIAVREQLSSFGATGTWHTGPFWLRGLLGAEVDVVDYAGMAVVNGKGRATDFLRAIGATLGYRFATTGRFDAHVAITFGEAGSWSGVDRELLSAALAVGLAY